MFNIKNPNISFVIDNFHIKSVSINDYIEEIEGNYHKINFEDISKKK
jgi:hypothetical protein